MSVIRAHFDGHVFVPDEPVTVPEGALVQVLILPLGEARAPLAALADLAETWPAVPDWPEDGAAQHDHYLYGTPKRLP